MRRADARQSALVAGAVLAVLLALELSFGANFGDAVLYLVYEAVFVVAPGWLLYRALASRPGGAIRQLAVGWALGYVCEVLAFMATAATGTRGLFVVYPLLVGVPAALALRRRGAGTRRDDGPPRDDGARPDDGAPSARWAPVALGAVCVVALVYIALSFFSLTPLPGGRAILYFPDYPWAISIAAEAKHHWPITDPSVAGEPFPYHYFFHIDLAAASQVTGIGLPMIFFRLFILPLTLAVALCIYAAGRSLGRTALAGILAVFLVLLVGELQLDTTQSVLTRVPFLGLFFTFLLSSPTFIFGLVFFVPLTMLLGELVSGACGQGRPGDWAIIALLAIGASDAKVSILPVVLVALGLFAGWKLLTTRRIPRPVLIGTGITLAVFAVIYLAQYRGYASGMTLDGLAGVHYLRGMPTVSLVRAFLADGLPGFPLEDFTLSVFSIVFGLVGLLAAQFVGIRWLVRRGWPDVGDLQIWYLAVLGSGLFELFFLNGDSNGSQRYGIEYGLLAGAILSAQGLEIAWTSRPDLSGQGRRIAGLVALAILLLLAVVVLPRVALPNEALSDLRLRSVCWYGGLLVALGSVYAAARRLVPRSGWLAGVLVAGMLLAVGAFDAPIDTVEPGLADPSPAAPTVGPRMTQELYGALAWIRDETPTASVLAVNSQSNGFGPFQFIYAAFAERPVYLEGYGYSIRSREAGYDDVIAGRINPFAGRLRVNDDAFMRASLPALRALERAGVGYLITDSVNGYPVDESGLDAVSRVVYWRPGVTIRKLDDLTSAL